MFLRLFLVALLLSVAVVACGVSASPSSPPSSYWSSSLSGGPMDPVWKEVNSNLAAHLGPSDPLQGSNFRCTICVIVMTMIENGVREEQQAIEKMLEKVCTFLPEKFQPECKIIVKIAAPIIISLLEKEETPSKICNALSIFQCNGCSLLPQKRLEKLTKDEQRAILDLETRARIMSWVLETRVLMPRRISRYSPGFTSSDERALIDSDKDLFSPGNFFRGSDWHGRDCDDTNSGVRPGVMHPSWDANIDHNCNGIYGIDPATKVPYENQFCAPTPTTVARTVVMFGDSASSAFHIPPEWLLWHNLSNIANTLTDEFDWPELSWSTGWNKTLIGPDGTTMHRSSVYLNLLELNRCNHRDFQNVGVNGAEMRDFARSQINNTNLSPKALSKPLLAMVAYIGNDVCGDTLDRMTTPEAFRTALINGLLQLDSVAPPNSKLLVMGLVDGRILWDAMHSRMHPFGATYETVYRFLSCTSANPCQTWLTPDAATRNATSARAQQLSQVASDTVRQYSGKLANLQIDYMDFPLPDAIKVTKQMGLPESVLIEPMDGFHPSHFGHRIFAQLVWEFLSSKHPDWIGLRNPNNDAIQKIFGNQGGY